MACWIPASVLAVDPPPPEPSKGSTVGQLVTNPITDQATTVSALIADPAETPTEGSTAFVRTSDGYVFLVKGVSERIYNQDTPPVAFNIVEVDPAAGTVELAPEDAEGNLANLEMPTGLLYSDYVTFFEGSETPGVVTPPEIVSGSDGVKTVRTGTGGKGGRDGALFVPPSTGGNGAVGPVVNIDNTTDIGPTNGIGIEAGSIGGKGGNGGDSYASFWSGRDGGDGGAGGQVDVTNREGTQVATTGDDHHGIFAYSRSGAAGKGGSGFAAPGGGTGGHSSDGGSVTVANFGNVSTTGKGAFGIYGLSVSNNGGGGGSQWGIVGKSGSGGFGGSGGPVDVTNEASGTIWTQGSYAPGILAQSVGGSGGSSGTSGNLILALQGSPDNGGNGGAVTVANLGGIVTTGNYSRGILGQSIGGGGGIGGTSGGLIALGGSGAGGGGAGTVMVTNTNQGIITTSGIGSDGIFVQSVGGSGGSGSDAGGLVSIGGRGAKAGHGGEVTVENFGSISTTNDGARGILAQSIGGGGGSGGGAVSLAAGAGVSVGGSGAGGGDGKRVEVTSHTGSMIASEGERSHGIFAQSVGGGGGDGGFAVTAGVGVVSVAVGGTGGKGGNGDIVGVVMDGKLTTLGEQSYGILAQSIGGGGGSGGFAIAGSYGGAGVNVNLGLGGSGGVGGEAKAVTVDMGGWIDTSGARAHGIFAQSVGGGGGDGGFAIAGSILAQTSVNLAMGGDGGTGAKGGMVNVGSSGSITTRSHDAHGILAQSVGGSGGNGGFTVATSIGGGASLGLAFGGDGGKGSAGGNVILGTLENPLSGTIDTLGDRSHGILAQSVGGGGGNGGMSIAGSLLGPGAITLGFGGEGGEGGEGRNVSLYSSSVVHTSGVQSHGILAQSVGGGGGAGGLSVTGGVTAFGGVSLSMGGTGGKGNSGGEVSLVNAGWIETADEHSYGIFAQSVGGGGGAGGASGSVMVNFSSLVPIPPKYPTGSLNVALALGGSGGSGGLSGVVDVDNTGRIVTHGRNSHGIFAQSVGGGGGDAGKATAVTANISAPKNPETGAEEPQLEVEVDFAMALGGDGGSGNHGNRVDVSNANMIETSGIGAHGIFAQSVGGGGGSGGDARSMILSIDPSNWSESDPPPELGSFSAGATLSIGGEGAAAGNGGEILVTNDGTIITRGADAFGILAQSVGGGGGIGGGGYHGLDWEDFGVPEELVPLADLLPVQDEGDVFIAVGGRGGNSGGGSKVTVAHNGLIATTGDGSIAVLAQSVGGGGGIGGSGVTGGDGSVTVGGGGDGGAAGDGGDIDLVLSGDIVTAGIAAHGVFAQSVGGGGGFGGNVDKGITGFGINLAMAGDGAKGGDGGKVSIENSGSIITSGAGAIGIYAQSVAGGGGLRGEIGEGFGFAGSAGGTGEAGRVEVIHAGDITTYGQNAHGIFAQSVGGADYGGDVYVKLAGDISVHGEGARAVIAQSAGASGARNIDFIYESGTITGGGSAAVGFFEGIDNTFTNHGAVTTWAGAAGDAITGTTGNDRIENFGRITGNIDLGAGLNRFFNHVGAYLGSGKLIHLGGSEPLYNAGILSPGGDGKALTTVMKGGLEQLASGVLKVDFDFGSADPNSDGGNADRLELTGFAKLGGIMEVGLVNPQFIPAGSYRKTVLEAASGLADDGLSLVTAPSVVIRYDLLIQEAGGMATDAAGGFAMREAVPGAGQVAAMELAPEGSVAIDYTVDFSPEGLGRNLRAVGDYFNRVQSAGGSPALAAVVTQLVAESDMQAYRASLSQMSPEFYGHLQASAIQGSQQFGRLLFDGGGYFFREKDALLWFNFLNERTDRDGFDGWKEADHDTTGIAFGVQKRLDDKWTAGAGLALEDHSADGYGGRWDADGDSLRIGLGIDRREGATRIGGTLSYSWSEYDVDRYGMLGTPYAAHARDLELETFGAMLRASHEFSGESTYLRPVLDLGYTRLKGDSVRETGAGGLNLALDGFNEDHFWIRPAIDVGWQVKPSPFGENWKLQLYGSIAVLHFLTDDHTDVTAGLSGAPAGVAAMKVPVELGGTHTQFTLGAELLGHENASLGLEYTKSMSDHVDFDAWNLRCRFTF